MSQEQKHGPERWGKAKRLGGFPDVPDGGSGSGRGEGPPALPSSSSLSVLLVGFCSILMCRARNGTPGGQRSGWGWPREPWKRLGPLGL